MRVEQGRAGGGSTARRVKTPARRRRSQVGGVRAAGRSRLLGDQGTGRTDAVGSIILRPATAADVGALCRLAKCLDTVNLPSDPAALGAMVKCSARSFAGRIRRRAHAVYLFVAEDLGERRIAGASVIVAKHGTPESPHYYLEVAEEERYSKTLRRLFRHTYLHLRRSLDGPTEVGGLIVDPVYRGHPEKIGKQLSYVRFLYMGLHQERFETSALAEMLPPLTTTGGSPLWECYGRRVTGLSFRDADVLSRHDKEFIEALFPKAPIYVCMLPEDVRAQIGVVGSQTAGALHLLEKIGFRFLNQIDPFDGGPYYGASLEDVTLIRELQRRRVRVDDAPAVGGGGGMKRDVLVGADSGTGLRGLRVHAHVLPGEILLPPDVAARLHVGAGKRVAVVPFL